MSEREISLKETKKIIHNSKNKDEISKAMIAHFKKFIEPTKNLAKSPKQEDLDNFIDYLSKPLTEDVKAPLFQRY